MHSLLDAGMMKLSVLLLLVLPALSSAIIRNNTDQRNVSFMNSDVNESPEVPANRSMSTYQPLLTVAKLREKRQIPSSSLGSDDGSTLEWMTWNNSLPNDAVSIYNEYDKRLDYICKYKCDSGFYTPSEGPYCHYPNAKKANSGSPFEILVNKNSFEVLEWKEDSHGSVPKSSVKPCPGEDIYVGKNAYGLGKVATKDKVFYLPWKGDEYWYNYYQVLTINDDIISQQIYDVRYNTNESKIVHYPPEIVRETSISNYECSSVVKTDTLIKTYQVEQRWDHTISVKHGVTTSIRAGIPFVTSAGFEIGIEISTEVTYQHSWGNTVVETLTDTVSVAITAPPNHSCMINMVRNKYKVDIPFTASLSRTYANGEIHTTPIAGMYDSVQIGEVRAVVDRCEPLENSKPCTRNQKGVNATM